jgi:hypothetical protein
MSEMIGPEIKNFDGKDYTSVYFLPDYKRFGLKNGLTKDMIALM